MPTIPILATDSSQSVEYKIALARAVVERSDELASLAKWRDYYAGDHELLLNADQKAFLAGVIGKDGGDWPVDNKCRKVVDKVRARLNVVGWRDASGAEVRFDGEAETAAGVLAAAVDWWAASDMDRWEGELYKATLRDAEGYLVVDHDGARPRFTLAERWDGASGVVVRYADTLKTRPVYAVKYWSDVDPSTEATTTPGTTYGVGPTSERDTWSLAIPLGVQRATIYTPSAVYKYAKLTERSRPRYDVAGPNTDDGWTPIRDAGDLAWPISWRDGRGRPLGLAIVPFISPRGSLIEQVIGLNNALNKTNIDLIAVADQQGFGNLVAEYPGALPSQPTNGSEIDPAGDGYGMRPGRVIEIAKGTLKKLEADDMTGLLALARHFTVSIASNADIPLHEFVPVSGEVPSGAALQMLDSALAMQADECAVWLGSAWRQSMDLAQRLAAVYGPAIGEPTTLTPIWAPTSYVDPTSEEANKTAMATRVKAFTDAGMPLAIALKHEGWTDEQILELLAAKEREAAAAQNSLADALAEQQRRFDQNQQEEDDDAGNTAS
jgi:hypothetical protein